jgi:hypothetical protein
VCHGSNRLFSQILQMGCREKKKRFEMGFAPEVSEFVLLLCICWHQGLCPDHKKPA